MLIILLGLIPLPVFALYDGYENTESHLPKNEREQKLLEDGFEKRDYALMPYGYKSYFINVEPATVLGSEDYSRCSYMATFPLSPEDTAQVAMKFPRDFKWPGGYDHSTFFVIKGGAFSYTDGSGKTTSTDNPFTFHPIEPVLDHDYVTIDFTLEGGLNHLIINSTNVFEKDNKTPISCKPLHEKPKSLDYYDRVFPILQQIQFLKLNGFPPDSFVCKSGLVGTIKKSNMMPACVFPDTKTKLIEREWASESNNSDNHILKYSPVLFKGSGVSTNDDEFTVEEFQKLQERKLQLETLIEDKNISDKIRDGFSDEQDMIQHYAQQAFDEQVPFEIITTLWEKRMQLEEILSEQTREDRFPIACTGSISVGFHAYSLDEKYVGNPTALVIEVSPEHFTKSNLRDADQIVRKHVGDEIDIVYEKSDCYAVPTE